MAANLKPVNIMAQNASEEKGENARMTTFVGAIAICDLVKTTLGPKGMDKILVSASNNGEIQVTNDGATILKAIHLDNPSAKILVDISKTQDDEVGDGTTSVTVLAGELLREAERLVAQKIHPQTIISGWRMAHEAASAALVAATRNHSGDKDKFRADLLNVARTTLSSKILAQAKDHFANIAVDAVLRLKEHGSLESIHVIKKQGGSLHDSYLDEGFILEKKIGVGQPKRLENPKILIANTAMDSDKVKIFGSKVKATTMQQVIEVEEAEREKMLAKCEKIRKHGINCFIDRQLIYNLPEQFFADHNIMAIEHADFEGIERLALALGGDIVSTFDTPEKVKLGSCKLIEEIFLGEEKAIRFSGLPAGEACTIVLRGASSHMLDEAERSLHDALCVLYRAMREPRVVYGGGCMEMAMAKAVDELATHTPGKRALALEAFARALRQIPTIIADNAGYDSADLVARLRAAHYKGDAAAGLDMRTGTLGNMEELGVLESFRVKQQVLNSAAEAAEMILRVDQILKAAPRQRQERHTH
jgi:T-complex protein 1 subunit beta